MKRNGIYSFSLAVILIGVVGLIQNSNAQEEAKSTVVRDSVAILLQGKTLPAKDFIHLYDTTPYMIMNGHVAAKLPCDSKSESPVKVLIGQAPNLKAADFELIKELSKPGEACLYHVDLKSNAGQEGGILTDVAIQNPTDQEVKFGSSDTVVIGINEIAPGAEKSQEMGNMTSGNSTG